MAMKVVLRLEDAGFVPVLSIHDQLAYLSLFLFGTGSRLDQRAARQPACFFKFKISIDIPEWTRLFNPFNVAG
jgi:hypothetical protein